MELRQTQQQQLKMAPMLFEAISLLQFNQTDLVTFIKEKALENPLLEYRETNPPQMKASRQSQHSTTDIIENTLSDSISFREELKQQVRLKSIPQPTQTCVCELIEDLDERGYWLENTAEWANERGYAFDEVEKALAVLHTLEPAGLGARNLQDCLMLQVERMEGLDHALFHALIMDHLELLAAESWKMLIEETGVGLECLQEAYAQIKSLTPYPVQEMEPTPISYIIPDLLLEEDHGRFVLKLDPSVLPKLSVNTSYYNELRDATKGTEARSYVREKWSEADWLLRGLAKREETLSLIAQVLTSWHGVSLSHPPDKWLPLHLKEVAEELGVHESTVSRAVKEKYVRTPYGLLELKQFFPKGMKQIGGKSMSIGQIKKTVADEITKEDPKHPLSDQDLAIWFQEVHGLHLSRRVIAKYRSELNIPSSMKRKTH